MAAAVQDSSSLEGFSVSDITSSGQKPIAAAAASVASSVAVAHATKHVQAPNSLLTHFDTASDEFSFGHRDVVHLAQCFAALIGHCFWLGLWSTILVGLWILSYPSRSKAPLAALDLGELTTYLEQLSQLGQQIDRSPPRPRCTSKDTRANSEECFDTPLHRATGSQPSLQSLEEPAVELSDDSLKVERAALRVESEVETLQKPLERRVSVALFCLQQVNVFFTCAASLVHVTKQFQASNDMFAISATGKSLRIDMLRAVTVFVLITRIAGDFAPLLKIVKLYPITMRRLDRLGWCIFVLALIWAARAAVAIAVGVEFCQMSNAAPETQPHKFKNADPHQEMYTFFTVTTPLHMSSLFAQVFYVMGIAAILGSTSIRFFIASGRQKIRRGPRIARLVMELTLMTFMTVLPIRAATWWAFGQCTFEHCPWPILDQNQGNVSVLASLFASVWSSIQRPVETKTKHDSTQDVRSNSIKLKSADNLPSSLHMPAPPIPAALGQGKSF